MSVPTIPELRSNEVTIPSGNALLQGQLTIPADAVGIVAFAHGSGSSRFSRRNQRAAQQLACEHRLLAPLPAGAHTPARGLHRIQAQPDDCCHPAPSCAIVGAGEATR